MNKLVSSELLVPILLGVVLTWIVGSIYCANILGYISRPNYYTLPYDLYQKFIGCAGILSQLKSFLFFFYLIWLIIFVRRYFK
ncbi:TPA: hypothetical protein DD690_02605 [Candidatus Daviesbacteria bacterium]|uniref:Uncharacterized protein n=1 Tax=Candidatus Daviesbacteria bacterium GW2011_GWF2_38_6 TaxID=1618432 RepID=A0A0G0KBD1_9BACT|nr:MAG: hypothetical protein US99_C0053G0002 [Candidatus Daviesbacteria bacterium GW2011_GWF2_38_6]OGE25833.1 MAG: hypothetical protein A3D02_04405 [Candidatus Daviesbacteria bacterium RIFCSPHIGHO2_02_FULL_39_41]OGE45606.1 MAG: hypothetical protein A3E67_01925 [Candidatus Daviesbacteria bacterium RIFCSPHIGHO2_12_FULL_38_25]OGE68332.1 MAG: hypothetical protein A3H81_04770 [Candidatus Daviesbacteria bacterium RIFCSPLOWO2_02_FULL_38_18]OGE73173.1 MAG: hypothetical protein A3H18_04220 [Candidatus D